MESANEAKYYSDLEGDYTAAELSFRHFLGGDAREPGGFFVHAPTCNNAAVCNCSFARLNCSEITALTQTVQNGLTAVLPESKQHRITVSSHERNVLGLISLFFGAVTTRFSTAADTAKPTSGIQILTTGDAGRCFWGPNGIMTRTLDFLAKATTESPARPKRFCASARQRRCCSFAPV